MDKNKFKDILQKARVQFNGCLDNLRDGGKTVVITILLAFVIMTASCLAVFFMVVQGAEKVLVPDVTGKRRRSPRRDNPPWCKWNCSCRTSLSS